MIPRRYVVVPTIVVLALGADIAVRLLDSGAPGKAVAPAVAGPPPSAPARVVPVPPSGSVPPGWSPSFATTAGTSPASQRHAGATTPTVVLPGASQPTIPPPGAPPPNRPTPDGRVPEEQLPTGQAPGGRPQTASLDDLLERDDEVPDGVAEQLAFFSGGGTECQAVALQPPLDVEVSSNRTIPGVPYICLLSTLDDTVRVTLTTPSGSVLTAIRPWTGDGRDAIPVPLAPGSPPGRYRISVQQGKDPEKATTEFVAGPARVPTVQIFPGIAFPGSAVHVYLGGFPPGHTDLHLYAFEKETADHPIYRTTHSVTVDATGTAYLTLQTSTFTKPTHYTLVNELYFADRPDGVARPEAYAGFWLR
ncbi:hypothetical protein AB0F81_16095 [Actinoplanes sp. NPDC024001]|uniref:hypothetical protein n=1 Tax=Actinoplanes sp. NPDC024001 TaxID=3154598 RepID=UPI0033E2FE36